MFCVHKNKLAWTCIEHERERNFRARSVQAGFLFIAIENKLSCQCWRLRKEVSREPPSKFCAFVSSSCSVRALRVYYFQKDLPINFASSQLSLYFASVYSKLTIDSEHTRHLVPPTKKRKVRKKEKIKKKKTTRSGLLNSEWWNILFEEESALVPLRIKAMFPCITASLVTDNCTRRTRVRFPNFPVKNDKKMLHIFNFSWYGVISFYEKNRFGF